MVISNRPRTTSRPSPLTYWKQQLEAIPPQLDLPIPRPAHGLAREKANGMVSGITSGSAGSASRELGSEMSLAPLRSFTASHTFCLPDELLRALQALSDERSVSLSTILLTAFKILLYRYTRQASFVVGAMLAPAQTDRAAASRRRSVHDSDAAIAFSEPSPLILRTYLSEQRSVQQMLGQVSRVLDEALAHSPIAMADLLRLLPGETPPAGNPLSQIIFAFQDRLSPLLSFPEWFHAVWGKSAHFDLALHLTETDTHLQATLIYDTALFLPDTVRRLGGHWLTLLTGMAANPEQRLCKLPLLTAAESQQLLVDWNPTPTVPPDRCLHHLFEAQVERTPDAIALIANDQHLTYRQLNERANQLARHLQQRGVGPDVLVAVCLERSLAMVISFLGVLKAGGAYVPMDPMYPYERRVYKLHDAKAPVILTQQSLRHGIPPEFADAIIQLDQIETAISQESGENLPTAVTPANLAYVIYTSGSTGNPKGVMIPHRGVVNHALTMAQEFQLQPSDRVLQFSSMSFDIIVEELYPTLLHGATLILRPEEISASIRRFLDFVDQHQITVLNLPTAFWHELVNGLSTLTTPLPPSLRLLIVGGEKASRAIYRQWRDQVGSYPRWLNTYGPTETTVTATLYDPVAAGFDPDQGEIPIGKAIANLQTYLLDPHLQAVPIGLPGELYIGGAGLARGYVNLPNQTASRFVPHPFSTDPTARLYKTGDTVRYLPDGTMEFVGRNDFQVKIRGFRIELGEIETVLEQHPTVQQAVVIAHEITPSNKILIAYILGKAKRSHPESQSPELRQFLVTQLPNYMIPSTFVMMDSFPLTPNGKVDRRALPIPGAAPAAVPPLRPRDGLEAELMDLWEAVLGIPVIGVRDNFFELGGHSLLAARLVDAIEQKFQKTLPPTAIFQAPTITQLADLVRQETWTGLSPSTLVIQPGDPTQQPILFCIHVLGENCSFFRPLATHLGAEQPVYGLAAQMLDREKAPANNVEAIAAFYIQEMRSIQPQGPYYLAGLSFGGTVVFEMAQQLMAQGQTVALLALLDTFGPNLRASTSLTERIAIQCQHLLKMGPAHLLKRFKKRLEDTKNQLLVKYGQVNQRLGRSLPYDIQFLMVIQENDQASDAYVHQPYSGTMTLFRATELAFYSQAYLAADLGWRNLVRGGLERIDVPGSHMTMVEEPHVQVLAAQFKACIAQAKAQQP